MLDADCESPIPTNKSRVISEVSVVKFFRFSVPFLIYKFMMKYENYLFE